jgi:hypothetical protein
LAGVTRLSIGRRPPQPASSSRSPRRRRRDHGRGCAHGGVVGQPRPPVRRSDASLATGSRRSKRRWRSSPTTVLYALTLDDPTLRADRSGGDHLPTTAGARRWRAPARPAQDEDRAAAQYHHAVHRLADDGWRGYEISNWARPGHESRHNIVYWERRPYEAVGPGAHAFDGVTRRWNAARLEGYLAALAPANEGVPQLPPGGSETIDPATAAGGAVILGCGPIAAFLAAASDAPLAGAFDGLAASSST